MALNVPQWPDIDAHKERGTTDLHSFSPPLPTSDTKISLYSHQSPPISRPCTIPMHFTLPEHDSMHPHMVNLGDSPVLPHGFNQDKDTGVRIWSEEHSRILPSPNSVIPSSEQGSLVQTLASVTSSSSTTNSTLLSPPPVESSISSEHPTRPQIRTDVTPTTISLTVTQASPADQLTGLPTMKASLEVLGPKMLENQLPAHLEAVNQRGRTVRFHTRVRISSGIHRHRPSLSRSSSASSSISVPLRRCPEEHPQPIPVAPSRPSQPVLSQIITSDPSSEWLIQKNMGSKRRKHYPNNPVDRKSIHTINQLTAPDEGSPIFSRRKGRQVVANYVQANGGIARSQLPSPSSYYHPVDAPVVHDYCDCYDDEMDQNAHVPKTEEDVIYGQWPARLLNHHWWWWKMGGVLCCLPGTSSH